MYTKQRGPIDLKVNNTYHLENSNLISRYPVNIDLHPGVIFPQVPFGLPTRFPTMADKLRNAVNATNAVVKWHLGFDHHYGFWLGAQGYYSHIRDHGYDLRSDFNIVHADNKTYSTDLFGYQAAKIISGALTITVRGMRI